MGEMILNLLAHPSKLIKAILGLAVGVLLAWGITLSHKNKKLSESLEMALNNIEAYLGSLRGLLLANNVLKLTADDLLLLNDELVSKLDSVREKLKIKPKYLHTAATQKQSLNVNLKEKLTEPKDSICKDSIIFNRYTIVSYEITKDSIAIGLNVRNTQYLYVYTDRHYKNKKSFLKRLFTLDFKKVNTYKYEIVNENDLILTDSVRVVEITNK